MDTAAHVDSLRKLRVRFGFHFQLLSVSTVSCLNRLSAVSSVRCRLPMKVGSCRAAFPRFFYNVTNQSCSSFIYGGCEANGNNFESQEDCEATCAGVTEHCEAEPKMGPCRASLKHWYYNKRTGSCEMFTYGGCRGNKNNYLNKDSCMQTCTGESCVRSPECGWSKPDPGPCRAAFPMFYYDPYSASCQSFMYGGCRGNENRYSTEDECMRRCIPLMSSRGSPSESVPIDSHMKSLQQT
uniref:BPTI/Kunitz inhibitor domain-containing protein n=1 Tax=Amphilophus citrinellus TaxID=61819 RepID=A0A3Q0RF38_AMPCI